MRLNTKYVKKSKSNYESTIIILLREIIIFKNIILGDKARNMLKREKNDRGVIKMILQTLNSRMHLKGKVKKEKSNMRKAK